jgi:PIN domain nuclease of toxin-antitoxin system
MRLLLDTHTLVWAMTGGSALTRDARRLIADDRNQLYFSSVNIVEVALKRATGSRRAMAFSAEEVYHYALEGGLQELVLTSQHALAMEALAMAHPDPFDRLLLAQAQVERLQLLTHDTTLASFDSRVILF